MTIPPRYRWITILSAWQFTAISLGYLFTRSFLKMCDEFSSPDLFLIDYYLRESPVLTRVSLYFNLLGPWLLIAPPLWWAYAVATSPSDAAGPSLSAPKCLVGLFAAVALSLLSFVAAWFSFLMLYSPIVT